MQLKAIVVVILAPLASVATPISVRFPCFASKEISLIDCQFQAVDLSYILAFPRALQYLSIGSDLNNFKPRIEY